MAQKSDRIAERLQKLVEEERLRKAASDVLISFPAWEADPILGRATQLRDSVTLKAEETALGKAFKVFDLDPNVPDHWHRLINYFARAHFEPRPAGAKTGPPKARARARC